MPGTPENAMTCPEFEALMAEALDGMLPQPEQQRFNAHRHSCPFCAELLAEAETGRLLLRSLEEVVPPADMVEQILAATSGASLRGVSARPDATAWERLRSWAGAGRNGLAALSQPRFAMSFAMAFFSVAMLLNITGVQVRDVRRIDLRPSAFVRAYEQTTGRLERYYENIRIVYEIHSRVEELLQSTTETVPQAPEEKSQPSRPSGELQPGHNAESAHAQQEWLRDLPSAQEHLTEEQSVRARVAAMAGPQKPVGNNSESPRSTL